MQNSSQPFIQKNVPLIAIGITCSSLSPLTSIQQDFLSLHTKSHSQTAFGQKSSHSCTSFPMSFTASPPYFTFQILNAKFNQPHQSGFHKSTNTIPTLAPNSINLRTIHNHLSSLFPLDSPLAPQWYRLEDRKGDKVKGELMLAVWMGTQADEAFLEAWHSDAVTVSVTDALANIRSKVYVSPKLWYLRVIVIEAQDLQPTDKGGYPEVFVKIFLGNQALRTRISQSRNINPLWNEDLMFVVAEPFEDPLNLSVEDRVAQNKEDVLGKCAVPLQFRDRRLDHKPVNTRWFNLEKHIVVEGEKKKEIKFASRIHMRVCLEGGYHVLDESTHYSSDLRPTAKQLWKSAGGIGIYVHNIRTYGSYICGTKGTSNGIIPMLRVFNDTGHYVDQGGGKRKGAFAVYLEPWYADTVRIKECIDRKLSSTYGLYRHVASTQQKTMLPLQIGKAKSYSVQGEKKQNITMFHTWGGTSGESNIEVAHDSRFERLFCLYDICQKLKVLICVGFEYCVSYKVVLEALFLTEEVRHRQWPSSVMNLDPKCDECDNMFLFVWTCCQVFYLSGQEFYLISSHCLGLFLGLPKKGSMSFTMASNFAVRSSLAEEFVRKYKRKCRFTYGKDLVYRNLGFDYAKFEVGCVFTGRVFLARTWDPGKLLQQ